MFLSAISTIGNFIGGLILVVFLSSAVLVGGFAVATEENAIRSTISGVLNDALFEKYSTQDLEVVREGLQGECVFGNTAMQSLGGISLDIPCETIRLGSASEIPDLVTDTYMDQVYFKEYSCDFVTCFNDAQGFEKAAVLVSAHANSFFNTMMWVFIALAIVGAVIVVASTRHFFNSLKTIGISTAAAGIPGFFVGGIREIVPLEGGASIAAYVDSILAFLSSTYLTIFVIGIILAVIGFVLGRKAPKERKRRR